MRPGCRARGRPDAPARGPLPRPRFTSTSEASISACNSASETAALSGPERNTSPLGLVVERRRGAPEDLHHIVHKLARGLARAAAEQHRSAPARTAARFPARRASASAARRRACAESWLAVTAVTRKADKGHEILRIVNGERSHRRQEEIVETQRRQRLKPPVASASPHKVEMNRIAEQQRQRDRGVVDRRPLSGRRPESPPPAAARRRIAASSSCASESALEELRACAAGSHAA